MFCFYYFTLDPHLKKSVTCTVVMGLPIIQRALLGEEDRKKLCLAGCWHRYCHLVQRESILGQFQISPARNGFCQTFQFISQAWNTKSKHPWLKEQTILNATFLCCIRWEQKCIWFCYKKQWKFCVTVWNVAGLTSLIFFNPPWQCRKSVLL